MKVRSFIKYLLCVVIIMAICAVVLVSAQEVNLMDSMGNGVLFDSIKNTFDSATQATISAAKGLGSSVAGVFAADRSISEIKTDGFKDMFKKYLIIYEIAIVLVLVSLFVVGRRRRRNY